ncbi:MAG: hypothetical protein JSR80_03385 [Verrucomicrobia bacterium]|nr:hypothetical protein [Verrucomicrobiota bacterium]
MVAITVYNIPEGASNEYAIRQQSYDSFVAEGMVGPIESSAAMAANVSQTQQQVPLWQSLFGLQIKTTTALFEAPPDYDSYRRASSLEAATLGPQQKRMADHKKVMEAIARLGEAPDPNEELAGRRIAAVIEQTRQDNQEILYAKAQMGSVLAG